MSDCSMSRTRSECSATWTVSWVATPRNSASDERASSWSSWNDSINARFCCWDSIYPTAPADMAITKATGTYITASRNTIVMRSLTNKCWQTARPLQGKEQPAF